MTTLLKYIEDFNTKAGGDDAVTGFLNKQVLELRNMIVDHSPFLSIINNISLPTKINYVPFVKPSEIVVLPDGGAPVESSVLGGIEVTRQLIPTILYLTDDTKEDAVPDMELVTKLALKFQAHSLIEAEIARVIGDLISSGTGIAPTMAAIMKEIAEFPKTYACLAGKFMVCMNLATYLQVMGTLDTAHKRLLDEGFFVPILCPLMNDGDVGIIHSYGVVSDITMGQIETGREGVSQTDSMTLPVWFGLGIAPEFSKKITVTLA